MRKLLSGFAISALLIPAAVSAATAEELAAQIQQLLQQVQALQAQQAASAGTTVPGTVPSGTVQCPLISRNLKKGMSGDDVTRLQQFLALDPSVYPEGQVTGFYGALTEAAVKRFQCKNKLVCDGTPETTGYGVTGPRTAALLALQCPAGGVGANAGGFIRVTPTSGAAPLNVAIEATVNTTKSCTGGTYEIIYGDNSAPAVITVPANTCNEMRQTFNHVYATGGTYTVVLRSGAHQTSATVTVSGGSSVSGDTFSANPLSGASPLTVTFTGTLNPSGACNAGPYVINFGDGQSSNLVLPGCSPYSYTITHVYGSAGTFAAKLTKNGTDIGSASITVGSGGTGAQGGGAFSVTPGYGGDAFGVLASFGLSSSCTAYDLDWGDGTAHASQTQGTCGTGGVNKEASHVYSGSGTYTVTLKRGTGSGQSTDSVGVTVAY